MAKRQKQEIAKFDAETRKWFDRLPLTDRLVIQTTVMQCDTCGLFYKPSLGHKCRKAVDSNG